MKIAFLFSGQGAQEQGMGQELYEAYPIVKDTIDQASKSLGEDIADLSFSENEKLHWTPYTQPILLAWSHAMEKLLAEFDVRPDAVAGLSLGEYTALVSANALSFDEAIQLVHKRGRFMDEACPENTGAMAAVLGGEREVIEEVCKEISKQSYVAPANYNMPGQIVIGGEIEGVQLASEELLERGAKKIVPLEVSGPFHTQLLLPAAEALKEELDQITIQDLNKPVYSNTLGKKFASKEDIKPLLVRQVAESVLFEDMIQDMIKNGIDTFIEVGPGRVLSRFVKKIDRSVLTLNVNDQKSLDKVIQALEENKDE